MLDFKFNDKSVHWDFYEILLFYFAAKLQKICWCLHNFAGFLTKWNFLNSFILKMAFLNKIKTEKRTFGSSFQPSPFLFSSSHFKIERSSENVAWPKSGLRHVAPLDKFMIYSKPKFWSRPKCSLGIAEQSID